MTEWTKSSLECYKKYIYLLNLQKLKKLSIINENKSEPLW